MSEIKPWFVYLIQSSKDDSIYTGITTNVEKRLQAHNKNKGAKYTKGRGPFILIKYFEFSNKSAALKEEYRIKQLSKDEKLKL